MDFGRCDGGGRRSQARREIALTASVATFGGWRTTGLLDFSATGARLCGEDLPPVGTDLMVRVKSALCFATIVWRKDDVCGVRFDEPLSGAILEDLASEAVRRPATLDVVERRAAEDWANGLAR